MSYPMYRTILLLLLATATGLMACEKIQAPGPSPAHAFIKVYGGAQDQEAAEILRTEEGGFILVGTTYSHGSGDANVYVVKTDSSGNMEWSHTYGASDRDEFGTGITPLTTGSNRYILCGTAIDKIGNANPYLLEIDGTASPRWQTYLDYPQDSTYDTAVDVMIDQMGNIVFTGQTRAIRLGDERLDADEIARRFDTFLMKLDPSGNPDPDWPRFRVWGFPDADEAQEIRELPLGGYAVLGTTRHAESGQGGTNILLYTTNTEGIPTRSQSIGSMSNERVGDLFQRQDGSMTIAGTQSDGGGSSIYLVTLDPNLEVAGTASSTLIPANLAPSESATSVRYLPERDEYIISGISGPESEGDIYLLRIDSGGQLLVSNRFGQVGPASSANVIDLENGFAVGGTLTFGSNTMMCLIKTDEMLELD